MKKEFVEPDMEVINFGEEDIITTSNSSQEETENGGDLGDGGLED